MLNIAGESCNLHSDVARDVSFNNTAPKPAFSLKQSHTTVKRLSSVE